MKIHSALLELHVEGQRDTAKPIGVFFKLLAPNAQKKCLIIPLFIVFT
jgi:hypothetical protein